MRAFSAISACVIASLQSVFGHNDTDILNFALNLECLEAQYYSVASNGTYLPVQLTSNGPQPIGGQAANLSDNIYEYAMELSSDESNHVAFLTSALGNASVSCPHINLNVSFSKLMDAALETKLEPPFSPYYDDASFLIGAFIFEDIGVTAYLGALSDLHTKGLVAAASAIGSIEAYHAATIRTLLNEKLDIQLQNYNITVGDTLNAISALRSKLGGGKEDLFSSMGSLVIAPADSNSLAFSRNTTDILNIVTFGASDFKGGFYPHGLNGAIH
jgi:hypothetical protein